MFAEWVTEGAAFGVKAFFALAVFGMIVAVCWVLLTIGGKIVEAMDDAKDKRD